MSDSHTRTVIVALPEGVRADWLRVSQILQSHGRPACVPYSTFPVRRGRFTGWVSRWSARNLLDVVRHQGEVTHAAGGRLARLDLPRIAVTARDQAAARWTTWNTHAARGTRSALPWEHFLGKHLKDPAATTREQARQRFEAQPRVLAMLAYNSYPAAPHHLDPDDLAIYQAGYAVYVALHWQHALTGDALITPDDRLLEPASTTPADRLHYLAEATHVVHTLNPRQHLVAVKAAPAPTPAPTAPTP